MFRRKISLTGVVVAALEALRMALEVEEGVRVNFCHGLDIKLGALKENGRAISIKGYYTKASVHRGWSMPVKVDLVMESNFGWMLPHECEIHYGVGGRRRVRWSTRDGHVIATVSRIGPSFFGKSWVGYGYSLGERWEEKTPSDS